MNYSLKVLLLLAWRYLWRNYRRTLIMLAAIIVGVWAMIFMTALMRGMVDDMVLRSTHTLLGHAQIHHRSYRADPNIVNSMDAPSDSLKTALQDERVVAWTARVRVPAVLSSERETVGLELVGINPEAESKLSFLASNITEGRYLESSDDKGVILGERLVKKLDTKLGKRVVLMSQDPDNNIVDAGFRIVGIYSTDPANIEEQFAFIGIDRAQGLLKLGSKVSEVEILGENYRDPQTLIQLLDSYIKEDEELLAWPELNPYMGSTLSMMDGFVLVWMIVVFTALSFGLVNTLAMAVFERVREIGLMLALGMTPRAVMLQVLLESLTLLMLGLVFGNIIAWLSILPLESGIDLSSVGEGLEMAGMSSILYPSLHVKDMLAATGIVLVLGLIASILPAWRASRFQPVQALTKN